MMVLVLVALAHAAEPTLWAGLSDERLPELQKALLVPTPPVRGPEEPGLHQGALRYALQGGGQAILYIAPGSAQAAAIFDGLVRTAAQHWPDAEAALTAERARGDGTGLALIQFDNAVILVRDPRGQAATVVQQLRSALSRAPLPGDGPGAP